MLWLIYQSSESNLDLSKAMITNGITTALAFTLLNNQKLAMKSTVAIANNTNNLNLKATNYLLNAQVPTTKLKTEITSEPLKITQ